MQQVDAQATSFSSARKKITVHFPYGFFHNKLCEKCSISLRYGACVILFTRCRRPSLKVGLQWWGWFHVQSRECRITSYPWLLFIFAFFFFLSLVCIKASLAAAQLHVQNTTHKSLLLFDASWNFRSRLQRSPSKRQFKNKLHTMVPSLPCLLHPTEVDRCILQ